MIHEVQFLLLMIIPLLLLGGIGWFIFAKVWPYVTAQYELTRQHRLREQEQFLSVLGAHAKAADSTRRLMGQMQEILSLQTGAIQRLADEIKKQQTRARKSPPKDIQT